MNSNLKRLAGTFIGISALTLVFWPLYDILYCHFVSHAVFHYSLMAHVVSPLIVSAVVTVIDFAVSKLISCTRRRVVNA